MSRPLDLAPIARLYLVSIVQERINVLEQSECNVLAIRLEQYFEMGVLRTVLEQLEAQP
jgi:hypothetical protein